jgi:hypothetical protein
VAVNDAISIPQFSGNNILRVLDNDSDPDGNPFEITAVTPPANGTVAVAPSERELVYTPHSGFVGTDQITYVIFDDFLVAFGTVTITVTGNSVPSAVTDSFTVAMGSTANRLDVLDNDSDPEGNLIFITGFTQGANGTVTMPFGGFTLFYTAHPGFRGVDTFTYTVSDGILTTTATVSVNVTGPFRALIPILNR